MFSFLPARTVWCNTDHVAETIKLILRQAQLHTKSRRWQHDRETAQTPHTPMDHTEKPLNNIGLCGNWRWDRIHTCQLEHPYAASRPHRHQYPHCQHKNKSPLPLPSRHSCNHSHSQLHSSCRPNRHHATQTPTRKKATRKTEARTSKISKTTLQKTAKNFTKNQK